MDGQANRVAATAEDKEELLMAQAFPTQAQDNEDIKIQNTRAGVNARNVRETLFA
jgi:hypothetical protein